MSVISHDFGAGRGRAARRLRALLRLDALHEANMRDNPLPYLERASEHIFQLEKALFEAAQAARPTSADPVPGLTVTIDAALYDQLMACRAVVEAAARDLLSDADDPTA